MKKRPRRFHQAAVLGLVALLGASCASPGRNENGDTRKSQARHATPKKGELTHEEAQFRARQIQRPTYSLWLGLDSEHEDFEGRVVINFDLKPKAKDASQILFVDFAQGVIRSLAVNGKHVDSPDYDGYRIRFATSDFQPGTNRIEIAFARSYSGSAPGFHRYKDPEDGQVYLYTDFEPFAAHRAFPCFDQPDLKASFELTVEAPADWQVVSSTLEREVMTIGGRKSWAFPPSPLLSTYVFSVAAGPFKAWKSTAEGIPLRLFARRSIARYVDAGEWFKLAAQGLDFFSVQFGYPYPYSKYDQVIVPEYAHVGMENAAAPIFSERWVFRSAAPRERRKARAETILHELAHMWFGDLVTLRWWNGIWLNESFATLVSNQALAQATEYKEAWEDFFGMKRWAAWEDQLVTSHPIESPVADTDLAGSHFDGITYGKGAAALRQLGFYLGEDDFREGVQRYFLKYALRNTSIHDFFKMLTEASGKDLLKWQKTWLQTSGINTVRADWACKDGKISRFALLQSGGELRPHKARVGLYRFPRRRTGASALQLYETLEITYTQAHTPVAQALKKPCPDFVFPNQDDLDYVKVELDPLSLDSARAHLSQLNHGLTREMVWHSLWQMTQSSKAAQWTAQDFAELVFRNLAKEKNPRLVNSLLVRLHESSPHQPSVARFLPEAERGAFLTRLEGLLLKHLELAPAGSDLQLRLFEKLADSASSAKALETARALLAGKKKFRGLVIDQERRWLLIQALSRAARTPEQAAEARELIQAELEKDPSDEGFSLAIAADASIAELENKRKWLKRLEQALEASPGAPAMEYDRGPLSLQKLRVAARHLNFLGQEEWMRALAPEYFALLPKLADPAQAELASFVPSSLFPALCDPGIVRLTTQALEAHPELPASVSRSLSIYRQEEVRCLEARALLK